MMASTTSSQRTRTMRLDCRKMSRTGSWSSICCRTGDGCGNWESAISGSRTVTAGVVETLRDLNFSAPPVPTLRDHLAEDVVRLYRGNLEILDALSRHYGFRYSAYWQPVVFSKRDPSRYEQTQIDKMEYVRSFFLDVYRRVAADSALRANPHFHNLSDIFDGAGPVYLDFCHITERGNGIVARRIYEDLCRR